MTPPHRPPRETVPSFSADLAPSADGASFAAFQLNSAATCEIALRDGDSAADFWFKTTLFQLPRAMLFKAAALGHRTRRGPEHIAHGNDQIAIYAFIKGQSVTVCPERTISAGPGDVVLYDFGQPHESDQTEYEAIILMVARERIPAEIMVPALHGALLPAGSGAAQLLHGMMCSLFAAAATLTVAEAEAAVDALILAARASLNAAFARAASEPARNVNDLMERALAFIELNLADPLLGPERIQAYLALSRSSLYRLFEPEGGVRAVILRQRLNACLRLLLTGQAANRPWWKLAVDHGFSSETQLARAFSRCFGVTPRAFHDMIARKDHAGLTAQAQRAGFVTLQAWLDHVAGQDEAGASKTAG